MTKLEIPEEGMVGDGDLVHSENTILEMDSRGIRISYRFTMEQEDDNLGMKKEVDFFGDMFYLKSRVDGVECTYYDKYNRYCVVIAIGCHSHHQYFKEEADALIFLNKILNWINDGE